MGLILSQKVNCVFARIQILETDTSPMKQPYKYKVIIIIVYIL